MNSAYRRNADIRETIVMSSRSVIAFSFIVTVAPASAQPAGSKADELYNNGRTLVAANKLVEACAAFEQSQKLEPAVATLIALATCREKLNQLATAWELFLEAERQTRLASDDKTSQLQKIALDRAARLEPRVPKLTISVPAESKIDRLEILRDKDIISAEKWNRALPIDGGTYTITARAPGVKDWSMRVTLAYESDSKTVDIPDLRNIKQSLDEHPRQASKSSERSDAPTQRGSALPIAVGAGTVVLLGSALGFSLWGDSTYDDAKAEMTDQAKRSSLYDSANLKRYVAQGLAVAGVGCAGAAVWLYVRQRGRRTETASAHAGHLMVTPTASGIGIAGQF
jgi:hypothetical protein